MTKDISKTSKHNHVMSRRDLLKSGMLSLAAAGTSGLAAKAGDTPLGFCPISGLTGDDVHLFGPNLNNMIEDVSARIWSGSSLAFTKPLNFSGSEAITKITAVPPAMQPGTFEVVLGAGARSMPTNLPNEITINEPICTWLGNGGSRCTSYQSFSFPWGGSTGNSCLQSWGGINGSGQLMVTFTVPLDDTGCAILPAGTGVSLRAYGSTTGNAFEMEFQATFITTTGMYASHIADMLNAMIISAFESDHGITLTGGHTSPTQSIGTLTVGSPSGSGAFTKGAIQIEFDLNCGSGNNDSMDDDSMNDDSGNNDSMNDDSMNNDSGNGDSMSNDSFAKRSGSINNDSCPSFDIDFSTILFN